MTLSLRAPTAPDQRQWLTVMRIGFWFCVAGVFLKSFRIRSPAGVDKEFISGGLLRNPSSIGLGLPTWRKFKAFVGSIIHCIAGHGCILKRLINDHHTLPLANDIDVCGSFVCSRTLIHGYLDERFLDTQMEKSKDLASAIYVRCPWHIHRSKS